MFKWNDAPFASNWVLSFGDLSLSCIASLIHVSKSVFADSKILKQSIEKLDLHWGHESRCDFIADGLVPCSFTLVIKCRFVLPM